MLVSLFEVRIHIFIITLPQTSEELLIKLLVLLSPEAPKLSHNYFLVKSPSRCNTGDSASEATEFDCVHSH